MGTRSLVDFVDEKSAKTLTTVYRQFDGYPSGRGQELADFLKDIRVVNGIPGDGGRMANGAGCLAAQWIAHEKDGVGGVYIHPPGERDLWEDYVYVVRASDIAGITLECFESSVNGVIRKALFSGRPSDFDGKAIEAAQQE